jgi:hypothetical protein
MEFIFVLYGNFFDFSVDIALSLSLELGSHLFKFLSFRPFETSESHAPLIHLALKLFASVFLKGIFLFQSGIDFSVLSFVLFKLMVELFTENLHFFCLIVHTFFLKFKHVASFGQFSDLNFIAFIVV